MVGPRVRLHITTHQQEIPGEEPGKDQPRHDTVQCTACCQHTNSHGQSELCPSVQEANLSEHKTAGNLKSRNTEDTVTVNTK